ncbi:MAG: hypothetical protein KKA42_11545 [candidate division Zixibacteria bacterium]|nr:hypothetical protein [candidate division Zixibacteria bacterium]
MRKTVRFIGIAVLALLLGLLAGLGCGEKDVPYVVDADALTAYIQDTYQGKTLFKINGLIPSDTFTTPFDNAVYRDTMLSNKRSFTTWYLDINTADDKLYADYGPLGYVREASVEVTDEMTVQTTRTFADSVVVDTTVRTLVRWGFFLKLGADNQDYLGWWLYGFNGYGETPPPLRVTLERYDGSTFPGGISLYREAPETDIISPAFVKLTDIDTVVVSSDLKVTTFKSATSSITPFHTISGLSPDGPYTVVPARRPNSDTSQVTVEVPGRSADVWQVLFIQTFSDTGFVFRSSFCAPYAL